MSDYHDLAIFFDLSAISRRGYAAEAWEIFFKHCSHEMLQSAHLFHGEVSGIFPGHGRMFCIAVRTADVKTIQYLKQVFTACDDKRLAPPLDRVRESDIISEHRLKYRGRVDSKGRLVTKNWSRTDQDLCKAAGWPYLPHARPPWLSESQNRELDAMSEPGPKAAEIPPEKKSGSAARETTGQRRRWNVFGLLKKAVGYAILVSIIALAGFAWLNREQYLSEYHKRVESWKIRRQLGGDGYAKRQQGFALLDMSRVPPEISLGELNSRFAEKGYYILHHGDDLSTDGSIECSVWFSEEQAGRDSITQGFISLFVRDQYGAPLWTDLAKGTIKLREPAKDAKNCRHESLLAAVSALDFKDLPDGRALRHYQKGGGFARADVDLVSERTRELNERKLQTEILQYMAGRWIMSQRVHLTSGSKVDGIVIERSRGKLWVKTRTGKMMIPANRVQKIEPFDEMLFSEEIKGVLSPLTKDFTEEWQKKICNEITEEMVKKFAKYGAVYPEACVVCLKHNDGTGEMEAVIKTAKAESTLKKGQQFEGLKVIGMDPETNSVLVTMGEGGEVLRIWPEPSAKPGAPASAS